MSARSDIAALTLATFLLLPGGFHGHGLCHIFEADAVFETFPV